MSAVSFSLAVPGSYYSGEDPLRTDEAGRPSSTTTQDISIFEYHEPGRSLERYFLGYNDQAFGTRALEITIVSGDPSHLIMGWGANTNTIEYPGPITADVDGTYIHGSGGIYSRSSGVDTLLYSTAALAVGDVISFKNTGFVYTSGAIALNGTEYSFGYGVYEGLLVASTLGLEPGLLDDGGGGPSLPDILSPFIVHLADGLSVDEQSVYARPEMATGHRRMRRVRTVPERTIDVAWLLTDAQMAQADDWLENALHAGSEYFSVPIKSQDSAAIEEASVAWWSAKWAAPPRCQPRRGGLWHYGGTLRLFGDPSATAPVPADLGAAIALPLYGSASLTVSQNISASISVGLTEQLSLGLVNFGLALTS